MLDDSFMAGFLGIVGVVVYLPAALAATPWFYPVVAGVLGMVAAPIVTMAINERRRQRRLQDGRQGSDEDVTD
ncbi:hypothetical protein [Microbacterium candidum]|uniref:DUF3099 domain-containing protein n=1 Tax=Microbacterium candidum TaxID=3041922 RepID=A0ABT7N223_9MICO|nr:hypothetical protein [Microbacterium sp. ASV49]MDL9980732.1 hypothetical protein [Microbacterium sp. ASV49]